MYHPVQQYNIVIIVIIQAGGWGCGKRGGQGYRPFREGGS